MGRLTGLIASAAIVGLTAVSASAQVLKPVTSQAFGPGQQAHLNLGSIQGVVIDEKGAPLPGAMVSALGAAMLMATVRLA